MERMLSTTCSADQASAMMKNRWCYPRVKNSHVRSVARQLIQRLPLGFLQPEFELFDGLFER